VNQIAHLIKDDFVPVTVNQLNGLNTDGEKGNFLNSLGKPNANYFHVATADGKLLAAGHLSGVNGDNVGFVNKAMKKWLELPAAARRPGAVNLAPAPPTLLGQPPPGGLVLRVYTRNMKRDSTGALARIVKKDVADKKTYPAPQWAWNWGGAVFAEPMPDVMWLTESEWRSLVPANAKKGDTWPVPNGISKRLLRFHLIDSTYGLAAGWKLADIRREKLLVTVEGNAPAVRLRLDGEASMATDDDPAKAKHGFDCRVSGILSYDPREKKFSRFDIIAVGDCWGGDWEGGRFARSGRAPLAIAFELAKGVTAADRVTPKGSNFTNLSKRYFQAERP
jgi:hypothetical protein